MASDTRDDLFVRPRPDIADFRFDAETARVFDDMIERSVPGYHLLHQLCQLAVSRYARPGTVVYDLGCSLGTASLLAAQAAPESVRVIGVDSAQPMLVRARERLASAGDLPVTFEKGDLADFPLDNASVVLLNYVLQFVEPAARDAILARIVESLEPGGVLVLAEKFAEPDTDVDALHLDYKRAQGYSELEISQKRAALERTMRIDTAPAIEERLARVGFVSVVPWFRALNFGAWLCTAGTPDNAP